MDGLNEIHSMLLILQKKIQLHLAQLKIHHCQVETHLNAFTSTNTILIYPLTTCLIASLFSNDFLNIMDACLLSLMRKKNAVVVTQYILDSIRKYAFSPLGVN